MMINEYTQHHFEFEHQGFEFIASIQVETTCPIQEAVHEDVVDSYLEYVTPVHQEDEAQVKVMPFTAEQREEILDLAIEDLLDQYRL